MTDDRPNSCPECASSNIVESGDELVCEDCGLVYKEENESTDESGLEGQVDWQSFENRDDKAVSSGQSDSTDDVSDWRSRFQEQREAREQLQNERKKEQKKQAEALDNAPNVPISWTSSARRLVGTIDDIAILYDEKTLYGVQVSSGDDVWEKPVPYLTGDSFSQDISRLSASFIDWRVILGEDSLYVRPSSDKIVSLSAATGDTQWECATDFEHSGRLVVADESLYLTNDYGAMMSISLDRGDVEWVSDAIIDDADWQSWYAAPPVLCDTLVVSMTNSDDGLVIARDQQTGETEWQFAMRETPSEILASQGQLLAGTVRGDVYSIDPQNGSQRWRHRLTEFGDPEDPTGTTRPTESVRGIDLVDSSVLITGSGFYSSVVSSTDGTQELEIPSTGVDQRFTSPDSIFNKPAMVTADGTAFTVSGSVIQCYDFDSAETIEEARRWAFEAADTIRATPSLWNEYLITTDDRDRVCLLNTGTGEPAFTCKVDEPAKKFVTLRNQILIDTKTAVHSVEIKNQ